MNVPLASGINTRPDERALPAPGLLACSDGEFTEVGGIQKRKPMADLPDDTDDGNTLGDKEVRRIISYDGQLLAFTKDSLFAWSPSEQTWMDRGLHLAVSVKEETRFARDAEQVTADYCEQDGLGFYVWAEQVDATQSRIYSAIVDVASGGVIAPPTAIGTAGITVGAPRIVAPTGHVFLAYEDGAGHLVGGTVDPDDGKDAFANFTPVSIANNLEFDDHYDVEAIGDVAVLAWQDLTNTQYRTAFHEENGTITEVIHAQTCDGPIAIAARGTAPSRQFCVLRTNGTNVRADLLDDAMAASTADVNFGTATATTDRITGAWTSVQISGNFRCYGFWTAEETAEAADFELKSNYVEFSGTTGTQALFEHRLGLASRAFDHDGDIYVWTVFAGESGADTTNPMTEPLGLRAQLQNSYFLYRQDQHLTSRATPFVAGGFRRQTGWLPTVTNRGSGEFAFAGIERRVIPLGNNQTGYAARSPRLVSFTFDSDLARRTVQLGRTLYVSGGLPMQYDGAALTELGFPIFPWYFFATQGVQAGPAAGAYSYKSTYSWTNAKGELDRSTSASATQLTLLVGNSPTLAIIPLHVTRKKGISFAPVNCEIWRTEVNPVLDAPFHLVTSKDPSATTGNNRYIANDPNASTQALTFDILTDAELVEREPLPENGGVLENTSPPPFSIITAGQDRLFVAGVPGAPNRIHYSRLRGQGEVASFNEGLTIDLPHDGGEITGLAFINETLVAFKERSIFAIPGQGFDNLGGGQNYGPPSLVAPDLGAISQDTVAVTPDGVIFKSEKGWYLLDRGYTPKYIGAPVADFDGDTFVSAHVIESKQEVRFLSTSRCLVYDYNAGEWSTWSLANYVDATMHNGVYHAAIQGSVQAEKADHTGLPVATYPLQVETAWIKLTDGLQGYVRVRQMLLLGEYRSDHRLRIEVARDYQTTYFQSKEWTPSPTTVGGPLQVRHGPSIQKMQAIKFRITDLGPSSEAPTGESLKLTGLALEIGYKAGVFRGLPAAQKQ